MKRRHVIVFVMAILVLGFMYLSVDTSFVPQNDVENKLKEPPLTLEQVAEGPVPQEPLRLNVLENPSFEEWNTEFHRPEGWYAQATPYQYGDAAYTEEVANGNYAGYIEGLGSPTRAAVSYLCQGQSSPITEALLEPGISLSFNWNALEVPLSQIGSRVYLYLIVYDEVGNYHYMHYLLLDGTDLYTNQSTRAYYMLNDTIAQWNNFDRNITEDFIAAFGSESLTSTDYIASIYFYAISPESATSMTRALLDDMILYNSTYSGWLENGDFETGLGNPWYTYQTSRGSVQQCTDSTLGTYSINLTIPEVAQGSGYARCFKQYGSVNSYYAVAPGMNIIELDWKYNDAVGAGTWQYAYMQFEFSNGTNYYFYYYFGFGDDLLPHTNLTLAYYFKMPGFGVRDEWQHSKIDLYDGLSAFGLQNLSLTRITIYVYEAMSGGSIELLVDNLKMTTYPTSDPTFEYENIIGEHEPFLGWQRYTNTPDVVSRTTDSHSGSYACNITAVGQEDGIYRESIYTEFDTKLATDFWWRLDHIDTTGIAGTYIQFEFFDTTQFYYIRYMLGKSSTYPTSNSSSIKHVLAENINQIGTWNNFARNITHDFESSFYTSSDTWHLSGISLYVYTAPGLKLTCLFDDIHFIDKEPPVISDITYSTDIMYYEANLISIVTTDARPGVSSVVVNYTTDEWNSWNIIDAEYGASKYDAEIPAQQYGAMVEFIVVVTDGCGVQKIADNGGAYYSYTVGDDIYPLLTIDTPINNTDAEGLLTIAVTAEDVGSGVEYVLFDFDGAGGEYDYTAPYEQNWDLDNESLGLHYIEVTVRDNAGLETTKIHYFTVVDTIAPVLDNPFDVEYALGSTGNYIDWNPTDLRPNSYEVLIDEVITYTGSWNESTEHIVINIDGHTLGSYNYTCVVYDDSGLWVVDMVTVIVYNAVPTLDPLSDVEFAEGTIGHTLIWNPYDYNPDSYKIEVNEIIQVSGFWNSSSEDISFSLDTFTIGTYNVTLTVTNIGGNSTSDTVWVTVFDGTAPILSSPLDVEFAEGTTGHTILWTPSDLHPASFLIEVNGSYEISGLWNSSGEDISFSLDTFTIGTYNVTLTVIDIAGNSTSDTVWVTVFDGTAPILSSPLDIEFAEGTIGYTILWTPSDLHPASYLIELNDTYEISGFWNSSGEEIIFSPDALTIGTYNVTLTVTDVGGNSINDTVWVTVFDGTAPILNSPLDVEFTEGTTGHTILWTPSDLHPVSFLIEVNGSYEISGLWNSSSEGILFSLEALEVGIYNITLIVTDVGGNSAIDTVIVIVNEEVIITTISGTTIGGDILSIILLVAGVTSVGVVLVVFVVQSKTKKT